MAEQYLDKAGLEQLMYKIKYLTDDTKAIFMFDNTAATYKRAMKQWFLAHNYNSEMTAADLTSLCNQWYRTTQTGWNGYVTYYQPSTSPSSDGTKGGDNANLSCSPSTDLVAGQDDYAGLPLFACVDCNFIVDQTTLEPMITAIDGITENFVRNDPTKFVGVLQATGYTYDIEEETTYTRGYCDRIAAVVQEGAKPVPEAIRVDGTIRPWVVHSKYVSALVNNKLTSCAGVVPRGYSMSHNTSKTYARNIGPQYSGMSIADLAWLHTMASIKYAKLDSDRVIAGACNFNYNDWIQVATTDQNYVYILNSSLSRYEPGMSILIGNATEAKVPDRGAGAAYSLSGITGRIVTAVSTETVDGTDYTKVTFDGDPITTASNPSNIGGTVIQSYAWVTGTNDAVLGNDGSIVNCTSGKYPAKLQGIEYMNGQYEVLGDTIIEWVIENGKNVVKFYAVDRTANQTSSITSNYKLFGQVEIPNGSNGWKYIAKMSHDKFYAPSDVSGSSSNGHRDGFYAYADGTTTGLREWRSFGYLGDGVATAGRSTVTGNYALSTAYWAIAARLSPNGNRGELAS